MFSWQHHASYHYKHSRLTSWSVVHQCWIATLSLALAYQLILEFCIEFEILNYQWKVEWLHFVCQSIHVLLHLVPKVFQVGPLSYFAQWVVECTIGNLGQEIKQPSNPYANLVKQGLFQAHINTLKAMILDLEPESPQIP